MIEEDKLITTSNGKKIYVYDNLFSFVDRIKFFRYVSGSHFKLNNYDGINTYLRNQFGSRYSHDDVNNMGITQTDAFKKLEEKHSFSKRDVVQARVNCITPFEQGGYHTDFEKDGLTFVYYCNLKWDLTWAGQLIFGSESLDEIEYASFFIPGRVIVFDGSIPHMIVGPNMYAKECRISFAIQYRHIRDGSVK